MKKTSLLSLLMLISVSLANAHFGAIIPSDDIVTKDDNRNLELSLKFVHPMELHYMEMAKPKRFGVLPGSGSFLRDSLLYASENWIHHFRLQA